MPFFFPDDEECHDGLVEDDKLMQSCHLVDISTVFEGFSFAIHNLRILTLHTPQTPIRVYDNLTRLEIFGTEGLKEELIGLDLVFRHTTALQSLSLVGWFVADLFSFFPTNSSQSLPHLTSFRLSMETHVVSLPTECIWALCQFLKDRPLLRSLYIRVPVSWHQIVCQLLPTIQDLVGLEVLGFHTGYNLVDEDDIGLLAQALSPKLKALHLAINWGGSNLLPLVYFLSERDYIQLT